MIGLKRLSQAFATKVGFIGLGNMGFPMAINLSKKGYEVLASDVDHSKETETSKHNIKFYKNIGDIAKNVNVIVTMLPNS
jgi:3-hydroxyisobutyrate dehydrogenase-like beta-hydroxyacid dehydrogenase